MGTSQFVVIVKITITENVHTFLQKLSIHGTYVIIAVSTENIMTGNADRTLAKIISLTLPNMSAKNATVTTNVTVTKPKRLQAI